MSDTLENIRAFAMLFTTEFHHLGYSDAVVSCDATSAENLQAMHRALSYMKGYADARRSSSIRPRLSLIANAVGSIFAIIQCMIDAGDSSNDIAAALATYHRDLSLLA